jgi:hypothetical protein
MPPKKMSEQNELILAGWAVYRSFFRYPTNSELLVKFSQKAFNCRLSTSWINKFNQRQHLSFQKSSSFQQGANVMKIRDDAIEFLKRFRLRKKRPEQIVVMDKTSFYGDSRFVRNISIKGGYIICSLFFHSLLNCLIRFYLSSVFFNSLES